MFDRGGQNLKSWLILLPLILCPAIFVWAQDDPFGVKDDDAASAATSSAPATKRPVDQEKDPIVLAVRDSNPSDPPSWLRALKLMVDIERYDEAAQYLQALNNAAVTDEEAFELQRQYGTGFLIELSQINDLGEDAPRLARAIIDGAQRHSRDQLRVSGLINQLDDRSIQKRTEALRELKALGDHGLSALVQHLAQNGKAAQPVIRDTLVAWGPQSIAPMIAALKSDSNIVRETAMQVLAAQKASEATVFLAKFARSSDAQEATVAQKAIQGIAGSVPNQGEATHWVYRLWKYLNQGGNIAEPDPYGQVEHWTWDATNQTVIKQSVPVALANAETKAWLAEDLLALDPQNREFNALYWKSQLEAAKTAQTSNQRLSLKDLKTATSPSTEVLEDILNSGLQGEDSLAAVAAVELLAEVGDASMLERSSGDAVAVVEALRHSDRRLRLAAAQTIIGWQPQRSFAGANRVAEALIYLMNSQGQPRVLIGHPGQRMNRNLVGLLKEIGYEADTAQNGRDLFFQARENADYVAILISDAVDSPEILELVQQLRKDPRTSRIPIGLLPRQENLERARRIARDSEKVASFPWPYQGETAQFELNQLAELADDRWPNSQDRLGQALLSAELLKQVARQDRIFGFEDLIQHQSDFIGAMYQPGLAKTAIEIVGELASPECQSALLDLAGLESLSIDLRTVAVDAFEAAIAKRGVLLTTQGLREQYDRYNASESSDAETQQLLGRVLDLIEQAR